MLQKWNKKIVVSLLAFVMVVVGCVAAISNGMSAKASGAIEANEVADGMLDVKMQVKYNDDGTANMRLVSSVNGLGYYRVGFEVYYDVDGSGTIEDKEGYIPLQTDKVLKRINAVNTGVTYNYSPKVVDTDAEYFITYTLMNISETLQARDFYVRAYVIPLDNKTVKEYGTGTGRYFNITEATDDAIINIPLQVAEDAVTVGNTVDVTVATVASTATVEAYKDGYAHLNVNVPANAVVTTTKSANKTLLASANKIEVIGENGSLGSAIYRNLDSTYNNKKAGDTTWQSVYSAAGENAFVIATDADLYGFASVATSIGTNKVYQVADITLNEGTASSSGFARSDGTTAIPWTPITTFKGTFDGQGHTISGLALSKNSTKVGMFNDTQEGSVIRNFSLTNSYIYNENTIDARVGSIIGNAQGGTLENVYSDAVVKVGNGIRGGGLVGFTETNVLTIKGCWFGGDVISNYAGTFNPNVGGFVGHSNSYVYLEDCLYTGEIDSTCQNTNAVNDWNVNVGGYVGCSSKGVSITNCISDGTVKVYRTSNSETNPQIKYVASLVGNPAASDVTTKNTFDFNVVTKQIGSAAAVTVTDATEGKETTTKVLRLNKSSLYGADGCCYTTLDFTSEGKWAAVEGGIPVLKAFAENPMDLTGVTSLVDYGWYSESDGAEATPYVLSDSKDLYGFSIISTIDTFTDEYVELAADTTFTLNEGTVADWEESSFAGLNNWIPVKGFAGKFDGQGSIVNGLYLSKNSTKVGMFNDTQSGSVICNFSLKNSYIYNESTIDARVGSIIGNAQGGTLENVYSDAVVKVGNGIRGGGLVGFTESKALTIKGCWFAGDVISNYAGTYNPNVGGFVGHSNSYVYLEDCLYTGEIDSTCQNTNAVNDWNVNVGGYVGCSSKGVSITNCISDGTVKVYRTSNSETNPQIKYVASLVGNPSASDVTTKNAFDFNVVTKQIGSAAAVTITDATEGKQTTTKVLRLNKSSLYGADGCRYTTLDFTSEGKWAAVEGGIPVLKAFAENPMDLTGVTSLVDYGWYSESDGAEATPYVLSDSKDLYGFSMISTIDTFADEYVELLADTTFTLNEGTVADWKENSFEGLNNWNTVNNFAGTFDGQGSVISGLYLTKDSTYAGLFGQLTTAVTVKNLSLKESYMHCSANPDARAGSIVGSIQGGTLTLQNVYSNAEVVVSQGIRTGGLVGYCHTNAPLIVNGCWFAGDVVSNNLTGYRPNVGGFVGEAGNTMAFTDCLFTGTVDATWKVAVGSNTGKQFYVGGFAGRCASTSTFADCLSNGTVSALWNTGTGADPQTMTGVATLIGSTTGGITATDVYDFNTVTQQTDGGAAAGNEPTIIKYASYNNANADTAGGAIALSTRVLHLSDSLLLGADGCRYTALDFENTWAAIDGKLPQLKYFTDDAMDLTGVTNLVDYAWYYETNGAQATPYLLSDSKDLYGFSIISTIDTFNGKYVKLAANTTFTLNEGTVAEWETNGFEGLNNWKSIVNFAGNFDGQGSTISGLYCTTDVEQAGMFKNTTTNATISNFSLTDSYLVSTAYPTANIGSIIGNAGGSMTNVSSNAYVVTDGGFKAGGLVGTAAAYNMSGCSFDGNVIVNYREPHSTSWGVYAGGLIGQAVKAVTLADCSFSGKIDVTYMRADATYDTCKTYIGGFVGRCSEGATITDYNNDGTIDITWLKNSSVDYEAEDAKTPTSFDNYLNELIGRIDGELITSGGAVNNTTITTSITEGGIFEDYPEIRSSLPGAVTNKYNMGEQDYGLLATSVTQTNYNTYITALINAGFVKHSDNGTTGMDNGRIYTTNLTKDDITLTVSYIEKTSEIHLTASYNLELSEYLNYNADSVPVDSSQETKLHMPELNCVGSSFIIQLKNGHFVIEDGGNPNDAPYLLDYLESLVPEGEKPVIEGWFISHPHVDHFGALQAIANTAEYRNRIYVEGVYFTIMTQALMEYMLPGSTSGEYQFARDICTYNKSLVRENGEQTKFHRTIMGQKYYFCDVEIDVVYTLEQSRHDGTDRNDNSTWLMYRIEGQRVLNTADANTDSFNDILYYYDDNYLDVDVYTTPHHGINVTTEFNGKLGLDSNDIVLYSNWRKGSLWWTTNHMTDEEIAEMNRLYTEVYTSGDATKIIGTNPDFLEAYDANIELQSKVGSNNVYSRGVVVNFTATGKTVEVLEPVVWKYSQYCVEGTYYPERSLYTNE